MVKVSKRKEKVVHEPEDLGDPEKNELEDALEDEEIEEPEEWKDEPEASKSTVEPREDDFQKEFKVLGQQDFHTLSKINVTSAWVTNATSFPAELSKENLAKLSTVEGIPPKLFEKVQQEIKRWFPVQKSVLPVLLESILRPPVLRPRDVTISAPTGSGKTLCYVLPSLTMVGEKPTRKLAVLILVPVQTLVKQIEQEFRRFNVYGAQVSALSGADEFDKEFKKLSLRGTSSSDVIISTPGRFMEHLMAPNSPIRLDSLRLLVVDEADRMGLKVRMEWLEVIERRSAGRTAVGNIRDLLNTRTAPRKLLLSATLSKDIEELHMWNLHRPCLFRATAKTSEEVKLNSHDHVTGVLALPSSIKHELILAEKSIHPLLIHNRIAASDWTRVLVFVNERDSALRLSILLSALSQEKYKVEHLTSDLFGNRRHKVLARFKSGTTRVLICSDILSRGVDVPDIDCVINYELPHKDVLFVHRAGRTARAGKQGTLLSIADKERRRGYSSMLKKTGLWNGTVETLVTEEELQPQMEFYQAALAQLKSQLSKGQPNGDDGAKAKKVSGFEHKRKRKWTPGLKEKREAEKLAKRGIWSSKKEKKDY